MRRFNATLLLSAFALGTAACEPYMYRRHSLWSSDEPPPVYVTTNVYITNGPRHPPPPSSLEPIVTAPDAPHRAFDGAAALKAIHAVDFAPCEAQGAPHGYGHAKLTFGTNGAVTKVLIDAPPGMSKEAVDCVGQRLSTVTAPEFDGDPVTAGASFFVK